MNLQEIEDDLADRCERARARGWRIEREVTVSQGACCALGARIVEEYDEDLEDGSPGKIAARRYGWRYLDTASFISGFDEDLGEGSYYQLGRRVAARVIR